jgi:prepilin-type processing-associated H-X9-DG protein
MPHLGLSTVVIPFICPVDARLQIPQISKKTNTHVAFTSFLGVAGQNKRANDGMLFRDSRIRCVEVIDGLSNTLLVGERPPSADMQYGWWYAGTGLRIRGTGDITLSVREPNTTRIISGSICGPGEYPFMPATGFDDPCGMFHFWSPHSGGANFAFADGSVRFLRYSANDLMPALATRAGGESASVE